MLNISTKEQLYSTAGNTLTSWRGDFLGFTFNGIHSSSLGIVRVSSGDRYESDLLPQMEDKTAEVPGSDGVYYFGSHYRQRKFIINFVFTHITDFELRKMRNMFGDRGIHDLIFDELPYKVYSAKVTSSATHKYICFDEELIEQNRGRFYSGEGSIEFTCFYPFARSRYKYLQDYNLYSISEWNLDPFFINVEQWKNGSGIEQQGMHDHLYGQIINDLKSEEDLSILDSGSLASIYTDDLEPVPTPTQDSLVSILLGMEQEGNASSYLNLDAWYNNEISDVIYDGANSQIYLSNSLIGQVTNGSYYLTYNPGDIDADWKLKLNVSAGATVVGGTLRIKDKALQINNFQRNLLDTIIIIDSKTNMIYGQQTRTPYNAAIAGGTFFKIPKGESRFEINGFNISPNSTASTWHGELEYDYLYF